MDKKYTNRELEDLYDSGDHRILQERSDFLLPQIVDFVNARSWINIRPEYQRRLVWDRQKKSRLIESLIMNVPVPPVFLYEHDLSRYEVMDGQQRLNTIIEFYTNRLKLSGLEEWKGLNNRTYDDLPPRLKKGLDRRRISATVLMADSPMAKDKVRTLRRNVFERLNTGGQSLNAQELRNCLYSGGFNDLIVELAKTRLFDEMWGIPPYEDHLSGETISQELAANSLFKRMGDCEIVLRFFAFLESSKIRGAIRKILDRCMEEHSEEWSEDMAAEFKERFLSRLSLAHEVLGKNAFKIVTTKKRKIENQNEEVIATKDKHSPPLYDAIMIALDRLYDHRDKLIPKGREIAREFRKKLDTDENFYALIVGRANTAESVKQRINTVEALFRKYL